MKIHAYKLKTSDKSKPMEDTLKDIRNSGIADRKRTLQTGNEIRVEIIEQNVHGFWVMDFVNFRDKGGPGKIHPEREIKGFRFGDNECFGEETACLYNPANNYFIIQYNHFGPRHAAIAAYLSQFNPLGMDNYQLLPKLDEQTEDKYKKKTIFKRLDATVSPSEISDKDKKAGLALDHIFSINSDFGGDTIYISIRAKRGKENGLHSGPFQKAVSHLLNLHNQQESTVTTLDVSGKEDVDTPTEMLDLLKQRLVTDYDIEQASDLRLPVKTRWDSLISAHQEWSKLLT